MYRPRTAILPGLGTTTPVGDISAADWGDAKDDISTLQLSDTEINLRAEGLALDGTTDETTAFQAVIDAAPAGAVISLDDRAALRLSSQVRWNGKPLTINGRGGKIICTQKLTMPIIRVDNAPGTRILALDIEGAETEYDGLSDSQAYAIYANACPDINVQDIRVSGVSRGLHIRFSDRAIVDGWSFTGMATALDSMVNYHSSILVWASHYAKISRIYAENCGSCLLVGATCLYGTVVQASGKNTWDNGIYISSGNGWEVVGPVFTFDEAYTTIRGTGVKMRGSDNTLLGGTFIRMGSGAVITGTGGSGMSDGYDGRGSRIIGSKAIDPYFMGFSIESAVSLPNRENAIIGTYTQNFGWSESSTTAGIRVITGRGHIVSDNHIVGGHAGRPGILVSGLSGALTRAVRVSGNNLRATAGTGIQATYVDRVQIQNNSLEEVAGDYGIRLFESNQGYVSDNWMVGSVGSLAAISIGSGNTNIVAMNPNSTVLDAGTSSRTYGNFTNNMAVTGSRGGNTALTGMLDALQRARLIDNQTTS